MKLFEIPIFFNYRVDKRGNVYSNLFRGSKHGQTGPWRKLKNHLDKKGYFYIGLRINGKTYNKRVCRIICEVFHGPAPTKKHQVSHLNGIKTDNRPKNLIWATQSENKGRDSIRIGEIQKNNTTGVRGISHCKNGYAVCCGPRKTYRKYFKDAITLRKQWEKELLESINR